MENHLATNQKTEGSNPFVSSIAGVTEQAYVLVLETRFWEFKSLLRYRKQ